MKPTWGSGHESGTNGASRHRPEQRGEYFGYVAVAGFACSKAAELMLAIADYGPQSLGV
jgi:hypothetical protein